MRTFLALAASLVIVVSLTAAVCPTADAAPSWGSPTTLGSTGREAGTPDVAVAPDGEAIAAWVGSRRKGIQVSSRLPGQDWSRPIAIAPARGEVEGPQIAMSAGKVVVVWTDNVRSRHGAARAVLAATRLGGQGWGRPRKISPEKGWRREPEGREPQIAMSAAGEAIVVWRGSNEGHRSASFINSATQVAAKTRWSAPAAIRGSYEGEAPQVAITPAGEAVAIWGASYNEESALQVSSRAPIGPWQPAQRLETPGAFPQPQLAMTSEGEAIAAWVKTGERISEGKVQVTTRTPGGAWKVTTLAPKDSGTGPRIVTEPGGRATVLWTKAVSQEERSLVASTHAPGGEWSGATSVAAEGLQLPTLREPAIAVTPQGESIALWASGGTAIQSSSRSGREAWSAPTQVSTSPSARLSGPPDLQLALAPDGQAFAVWRCFDGTRWVIKAAARPAAGPTG